MCNISNKLSYTKYKLMYRYMWIVISLVINVSYYIYPIETHNKI